jgi:hypothetical protein
MHQPDNWINHPTKKQLVLTIISALTGFILLLLAMTDFFNESPFQKKYFIIYLLFIGVGIRVYQLVRNYLIKTKR